MARRRWRIDWPTAIAFVTAVAALVTAISTCNEVREARDQSAEARFALSVSTLQNLEADFASSRMRRARRDAAAGLLVNDQDETEGLDEVLNFFDTVGLLVRRRAVDEEMAWHDFDYWVTCYGGVSTTVVRKVRQKHPTEWEDFIWLRRRLDDRETARIGSRAKCSEPPPEFLTDETQLN